jgi:PAS domain S-box-containing protein
MKTNQEKISTGAFLIVIGISALALVGLLADRLSWSALNENFIPMAPATAVSFIVAGIVSLNLLLKNKHTIVYQIILPGILVFNLLILVDNLFNYPIGIERIFGESPGIFQNQPMGRMSPVTCVLFLTEFISLLIVTRKSDKIASLLCTTGLLAALIFDLGYLYETPLLYGKAIIPPALNTSIAFTLLFTGNLIGFGQNEMPIRFFVGESVRARLMRNFLPLTLLIIILAGWANTFAIQFFSDHILFTALVTITSLFVLSIIILKLSKNIGNNIDHLFKFRKEVEEKLRESELHFRTLADSGQALIWTSGIDKKCNYFNQPWLDFTGRSLEQELGDGWTQGVHPQDLDYCIITYSEAFDRQEKFNIDYRLRHRDGNFRWIQDNGTPRFNLHGEFIGYIGHCLDITERKLAEETLIKSEEKYRLISSVTTDYTFSTKVMPNGSLDLNWVAGAFESISGYSVDEFKARGGWRASVHPDDIHIDDNDIARLKRNLDTESQIRTINREGQTVWVQVFAHPVWDEEKNCLSGIFGAVKNINDRKAAEEQLINSERRFRNLLEKVNLIAIILDQNGKVTFCNDHLLKITGYEQEEVIGKDWFNLMMPEGNRTTKDLFFNELNNRIIPRLESQIVARSGKKLEIAWSNVTQHNHQNQMIGLACIGEDITERKHTEINLQETNERLKLILENTPIAIWDWDIRTDIWYATPKYYTLLGYEPEPEYPDRNIWLSRLHPDDREYVSQKINTILNLKEEQYSYTARLLHANGTYRWQTVIGQIIERDESGKAARLIGIRMDIDETKKAEDEIRKLNMQLEQKVKERTLELEQKNGDLERMNKLFVGRELRMIELKNTIHDLEEKLKTKDLKK